MSEYYERFDWDSEAEAWVRSELRDLTFDPETGMIESGREEFDGRIVIWENGQSSEKIDFENNPDYRQLTVEELNQTITFKIGEDENDIDFGAGKLKLSDIFEFGTNGYVKTETYTDYMTPEPESVTEKTFLNDVGEELGREETRQELNTGLIRTRFVDEDWREIVRIETQPGSSDGEDFARVEFEFESVDADDNEILTKYRIEIEGDTTRTEVKVFTDADNDYDTFVSGYVEIDGIRSEFVDEFNTASPKLSADQLYMIDGQILTELLGKKLIIDTPELLVTINGAKKLYFTLDGEGDSGFVFESIDDFLTEGDRTYYTEAIDDSGYALLGSGGEQLFEESGNSNTQIRHESQVFKEKDFMIDYRAYDKENDESVSLYNYDQFPPSVVTRDVSGPHEITAKDSNGDPILPDFLLEAVSQSETELFYAIYKPHYQLNEYGELENTGTRIKYQNEPHTGADREFGSTFNDGEYLESFIRSADGTEELVGRKFIGDGKESLDDHDPALSFALPEDWKEIDPEPEYVLQDFDDRSIYTLLSSNGDLIGFVIKKVSEETRDGVPSTVQALEFRTDVEDPSTKVGSVETLWNEGDDPSLSWPYAQLSTYERDRVDGEDGHEVYNRNIRLIDDGDLDAENSSAYADLFDADGVYDGYYVTFWDHQEGRQKTEFFDKSGDKVVQKTQVAPSIEVEFDPNSDGEVEQYSSDQVSTGYLKINDLDGDAIVLDMDNAEDVPGGQDWIISEGDYGSLEFNLIDKTFRYELFVDSPTLEGSSQSDDFYFTVLGDPLHLGEYVLSFDVIAPSLDLDKDLQVHVIGNAAATSDGYIGDLIEGQSTALSGVVKISDEPWWDVVSFVQDTPTSWTVSPYDVKVNGESLYFDLDLATYEWSASLETDYGTLRYEFDHLSMTDMRFEYTPNWDAITAGDTVEDKIDVKLIATESGLVIDDDTFIVELETKGQIYYSDTLVLNETANGFSLYLTSTDPNNLFPDFANGSRIEAKFSDGTHFRELELEILNGLAILDLNQIPSNATSMRVRYAEDGDLTDDINTDHVQTFDISDVQGTAPAIGAEATFDLVIDTETLPGYITISLTENDEISAFPDSADIELTYYDVDGNSVEFDPYVSASMVMIGGSDIPSNAVNMDVRYTAYDGDQEFFITDIDISSLPGTAPAIEADGLNVKIFDEALEISLLKDGVMDFFAEGSKLEIEFTDGTNSVEIEFDTSMTMILVDPSQIPSNATSATVRYAEDGDLIDDPLSDVTVTLNLDGVIGTGTPIGISQPIGATYDVFTNDPDGYDAEVSGTYFFSDIDLNVDASSEIETVLDFGTVLLDDRTIYNELNSAAVEEGFTLDFNVGGYSDELNGEYNISFEISKDEGRAAKFVVDLLISDDGRTIEVPSQSVDILTKGNDQSDHYSFAGTIENLEADMFSLSNENELEISLGNILNNPAINSLGISELTFGSEGTYQVVVKGLPLSASGEAIDVVRGEVEVANYVPEFNWVKFGGETLTEIKDIPLLYEDIVVPHGEAINWTSVSASIPELQVNLSNPLDILLLNAEYQIFQFSIAESKDEDPYTVGDEEAWVDLNILVSRWGDGLNEYWRIPSIDELDPADLPFPPLFIEYGEGDWEDNDSYTELMENLTADLINFDLGTGNIPVGKLVTAVSTYLPSLENNDEFMISTGIFDLETQTGSAMAVAEVRITDNNVPEFDLDAATWTYEILLEEQIDLNGEFEPRSDGDLGTIYISDEEVEILNNPILPISSSLNVTLGSYIDTTVSGPLEQTLALRIIDDKDGDQLLDADERGIEIEFDIIREGDGDTQETWTIPTGEFGNASIRINYQSSQYGNDEPIEVENRTADVIAFGEAFDNPDILSKLSSILDRADTILARSIPEIVVGDRFNVELVKVNDLEDDILLETNIEVLSEDDPVFSLPIFSQIEINGELQNLNGNDLGDIPVSLTNGSDVILPEFDLKSLQEYIDPEDGVFEQDMYVRVYDNADNNNQAQFGERFIELGFSVERYGNMPYSENDSPSETWKLNEQELTFNFVRSDGSEGAGSISNTEADFVVIGTDETHEVDLFSKLNELILKGDDLLQTVAPKPTDGDYLRVELGTKSQAETFDQEGGEITLLSFNMQFQAEEDEILSSIEAY